MAAAVILVEARPRSAADGAAVLTRLAGLGGTYPYFYDGAHWRAGIAGLPRTIASLDFDGEQVGGGGVPQAMELRWSPAGRALLADVAALYWTDAPITVRIGPEGEALPPIATAGLVLDGAVEGGALRIVLSDSAAELKKPLLTDRFAGTGGIEGPVELENIIKSRSWGRCFNVPGQLIERASNIWCFGDPRRAWRSFVQVRDRGVAATAVLELPWQGSAEATFAALKGAAAPEGGCIVCPSIACVKWWTQAGGDLKADIEGETAGGYAETAPEIAARLVAIRSTIPIAAGALSEAVAWRPAAYGWRADNETVTAADAISEVLGDVSLSWLLIGGEICFRRWEWTASTRVARSHRVTRRSTIKPVGTRKLGYRRNWSPMARGDLAAIVLAQDVTYEDGTSAEAWKPAQPGADKTSDNTSRDTKAVGGVPAPTVLLQLEKIDQIEPIKSDVSAIELAQLGHADELAVLDQARVDMEAIQRQVDRDAGKLDEALLRLLSESSRTREVLRDAGIVVDPATGVVRIYAVDQVAERTNRVEVGLDAVRGTVSLKADSDWVNERIALAVLDPVEAANLEPIIKRLAKAEIEVDGLKGAVTTKADVIELTKVGGRVTTAEQDIDALKGSIVNKLDKTTFDGLSATVQSIEQKLDTVGDTTSYSLNIRQARLIADDAATAALRGLLAGDEANQRQIVQAAQARQDIFTRLDGDKLTEAQARLTLTAEVGAVRAMAVRETTARIDAVEAVARDVSALGVTSRDQTAAIGEVNEAVIDAKGGLARNQMTIRQVVGRADSADEAILRALIQGDNASLARQAQVVQIQTEFATTLTANEAAGAVARQALLARMNAAEAAIVDVQKVLADNIQSLVERVRASEAVWRDPETGLVATRSRLALEEKLNADRYKATGKAIEDLSTAFNDPVTGLAAAFSNIGEVRDTAAKDNEATAKAVRTLNSTVNDPVTGLPAAFSTIGEVRDTAAKQNEATAKAVDTLGSTVNDPDTGLPGAFATIGRVRDTAARENEATAKLVDQVRAAIDGVGNVGLQQAFEAVVDRLGKIEGRWSIMIDANGNTSGIQLIGSTSGPASFGLINTDLKMGTGRVVFDDGKIMLVHGVGFGAARDLLEWFGPTMAIDKCSRANAKSYKATDGSEYMGGGLSAGSLKNGNASSSLAADAVAEVSSFGSNGKPVKYVCSWFYYSEYTRNFSADNNGAQLFQQAVDSFGATSDDGGYVYFGTKKVERVNSTITLSRAFAGASYTQLEERGFTTEQTTFRGLKPTPGDAPGRATYTETIGGGFTVTDPVQSTANRSLKLTLSRGFNLSEGVIQRLTIIAVEE